MKKKRLVPLTASTESLVLFACGTFNPITNFHLRMFEFAKEMLEANDPSGCRVVAGVLSPALATCQKKLAHAQHRIEMIRLATTREATGQQWIFCDVWESQQTTWLPTNQVLQSFVQRARAKRLDAELQRHLALANIRSIDNDEDIVDKRFTEMDDPPTFGLVLLCSYTMAIMFDDEKVWPKNQLESILSEHRIVCVCSKTGEASKLEQLISSSDFLFAYQSKFHIFTDWLSVDYCPSKIRKALKRSNNVKYFVPDPVLDYIQQFKLYNTTSSQDSHNDQQQLKNAEVSIEKPVDDDNNDTSTIFVHQCVCGRSKTLPRVTTGSAIPPTPTPRTTAPALPSRPDVKIGHGEEPFLDVTAQIVRRSERIHVRIPHYEL